MNLLVFEFWIYFYLQMQSKYVMSANPLVDISVPLLFGFQNHNWIFF